MSLNSRCASCETGTLHSPNRPQACYDERSSEEKQMTTAQRMEKQFFLNLIRLVNEVQGKQTLPSQITAKKKSTWVKQIKSQKQKKDALASV